MNDKYIIDSFETIHIDEKSMLKKVRDEIDMGAVTPETRGSGKKLNRRFVVAFAAVVMVMGFTAVAYATGLFNLGTLQDPYNSNVQYEFIAVEGSDQYNAAKEYNDYLNGLSQSELNQLGSAQEIKHDEKTGAFIKWNPDEELQGILEKYNLKYSISSYHVDTPQEAIQSTKLAGFADTFLAQYDNGKGTYIHYDVGNLVMANRISADYWEFSCYPKDAYIEPQAFYYPKTKIKGDSFTEWFYTTQNGHTAKVVSYEKKGAYENKDGTETPCTFRIYRSIILAGEYTFLISFDKGLVDGNDMTKTEFEVLLEEFDFSKLD